MAEQFDSKSFNAEAFKYLVGRVPNLNMTELKKSRALAGNPDIRNVFTTQNGTAYAKVAMRGLIDGDAVNYDGETDIPATSTKTFEQGMIVVGRAKAWTEKDFSNDITGGVDFMGNISQQVAEYKDNLDQQTLLAILTGIFAMTGTKNAEFVNAHTYDTTKIGDGKVGATTLNSAMNKACGAHKKNFTLVVMHPDIATNLENLKLIEYMKYTDAEGITRSLAIGTWGGRLVVVDDSMPVMVNAIYAKTTDTTVTAGKIYYTKTGENYSAVETPAENPKTAGYFEKSESDESVYTTYILGNGAISYEDIGAKIPYEMSRDPKTNGGVDTLYMRQRKVFAPFGISYEKMAQASLSPTDAELKNGANWSLVHSGEATESERSYINHKAIAIARILSKG